MNPPPQRKTANIWIFEYPNQTSGAMVVSEEKAASPNG
jgi:hypothetical protein